MKKLLVLLLISALAIFVFAGCDGFGPPAEGEGEGEGEGEVEEVTVAVEGETIIGGKTYVKGGVSRDITITFPAPVENAQAYVSGCGAGVWYPDVVVVTTSDIDRDRFVSNSDTVALWPNEDKTVWEGSYTFNGSDCCSAYVMVEAGECEPDACVYYPIVVDSGRPYANISIKAPTTDPCTCGGCAWEIKSGKLSDCAETECCDDDCAGLANWSIAIFDNDPFNVCCEVPCEEPIFTCSGTECPIDCTTDCLTEYTDGSPADGMYYVVVSLVDNVGNDMEYYATIKQDSACTVEIEEYPANIAPYDKYFLCTDFDENDGVIRDMVDDFIGMCDENTDGYGTKTSGTLE
jgi:hypothetical protein